MFRFVFSFIICTIYYSVILDIYSMYCLVYYYFFNFFNVNLKREKNIFLVIFLVYLIYLLFFSLNFDLINFISKCCLLSCFLSLLLNNFVVLEHSRDQLLLSPLPFLLLLLVILLCHSYIIMISCLNY